MESLFTNYKLILYFLSACLLFACEETKQEDKIKIDLVKKELDNKFIQKIDTVKIDSVQKQVFAKKVDSNLYWINYFHPDSEFETDTFVSLSFLDKNLYLYNRFNYPKLNRQYKDDSILIVGNDTIKVSIKSTNFINTENKITYSNSSNLVEEINDKGFWGTDGNIPEKSIFEIKIEHNEVVSILDKTTYDNLFEPNLGCIDSNNCFIEVFVKKNKLILSMLNSDGAGGYTAIFVINLTGAIENRLVGYGF